MMGNEVYDLLIIGSGPAGMGAAVYAARAGLKAAVVDRSPVSGGQVQSTYEVDNYLGLPGLSGENCQIGSGNMQTGWRQCLSLRK